MDDDIVSAGPQTVFSKGDFRRRLSISVQRRIDNFDIQEYVAIDPKIQALTVEQRADVRTAIATWRDVGEVHLNDERTIAFFGMLDAYGLLDHEGQSAEILAP